jgi:hypothetical protein
VVTRNDVIAGAVNGAHACYDFDFCLFANHMNRILMTGVKGIKYHLIDVSKHQLDAGICQ